MPGASCAPRSPSASAGTARHDRCARGRRPAVRRLDRLEHVPARLRLPAGLRADRLDAIEEAIELNGAAIEMNRQAFRLRPARRARSQRHRAADCDAGEGCRCTARPGCDRRRSRRASRRLSGRGAGGALSREDRLDRRGREGEGAGRLGSRRCGRAAATTSCSPTRTSTRSRASTPTVVREAARRAVRRPAHVRVSIWRRRLGWLRKDKVTGHPRKIELGPWMTAGPPAAGKCAPVSRRGARRVRLHRRAPDRAAA